LRHDALAAANSLDAGSTPDAPASIWIFTPFPLLETDGSGRIATPCERMHEANLTAASYSVPAFEPLAAGALVVVVVVVDPRLATPAAGPPPHAAASEAMPPSAARIVSVRARGRDVRVARGSAVGVSSAIAPPPSSGRTAARAEALAI